MSSVRLRLRRAVAGLAVAVAAAAAVVPGPVPAPAAGAAGQEDDLQVLFVLDVSGSMGRVAPGGASTLLQGAKSAITQVSRSLPAEVALGLRLYGAEYGGTDTATACADTQLAVPPRPGSADQVVEALSGLTPRGDTPIGRSLLESVDDFAAGDGRRVVVLISDGEDTCAPPGPAPCKAAEQIERQDAAIQVETVGLALGGQPAAVNALRCIARATHGTYYSADNTQALAAALRRIADDTIARLGGGKPITGGPRADAARRVGVGAYRDTLRPGATKWYRFRAQPGDLPQVLASVKGPENLRVRYYGRDCATWELRLYNPYGEGGSYQPYGGIGIFDGSGIAAIGAETTDVLADTGVGIDYPGMWSFSVSLARTAIEDCADYFPHTDFPIRISVTLDPDARSEPSDEQGGDQATESPTIDPSDTASPSPSGSGDEFVTPALPPTDVDAGKDSEGGSIDWTIPALVVLLGALGVLAARLIRKRRTGM
ncbi:vWA domain-containing protein [Nocardioides conyzicola]|uniref:VWFA domain-containing protein n=1 Tax=Nocardioides conyzicola TaxID=1651781 RepID=A0ABP8XD24_9ACTN